MENNVVNINANPEAQTGAAQAAPVNAIQDTNKSNLQDVRTDVGAFYIGTFDGKPRYIRYDLNSFAEMEERYGSMDEAQKRLEGGSMKDVRTILWLGVIWNEVELDPVTGDLIRYTISERQVGSWLHTLNMKDVLSKLQIAITGALPEVDNNNQAVVTPINAAAANVVDNPN